MEGERRYGISRAGLLSLVTFAWVGPLIKWGAVRELTLGDGKRLVAVRDRHMNKLHSFLPVQALYKHIDTCWRFDELYLLLAILSTTPMTFVCRRIEFRVIRSQEKDEAGVLSSRFDKWWAKATEGAERDEAGQPKRPSRVFLAALFRTHWVKLLSQALWLLLESSLRLTSRVVLRMFLTWLTATQLSDAAAPEWKVPSSHPVPCHLLSVAHYFDDATDTRSSPLTSLCRAGSSWQHCQSWRWRRPSFTIKWHGLAQGWGSTCAHRAFWRFTQRCCVLTVPQLQTSPSERYAPLSLSYSLLVTSFTTHTHTHTHTRVLFLHHYCLLSLQCWCT
jgi:hypothetical protein